MNQDLNHHLGYIAKQKGRSDMEGALFGVLNGELFKISLNTSFFIYS
jgi:hypothetical protein